jgi:hypothetical protein
MRPKSTLLTGTGKGPARPPEAEEYAGAGLPAVDDLIPLPQPGDPYKAHARPDNKPLLTLTFLCKDSAEEGFAYSDLRRIRLLPGKPGGGPVLVLRFTEAAIVEVRIEGLRLDAMRGYIRYHRIAWVRELPPGKMIADKTAAVVTSISITQVES